MLSSPIILYDFPAVAPESAGDFCDATEIDEILALRVMTLTDDEKAEARGTDPRAAAIIDRCDDMPDEIWSRLHGAVRSLRPDRSTRRGSTRTGLRLQRRWATVRPCRGGIRARTRRSTRSPTRCCIGGVEVGKRHTRAPEALAASRRPRPVLRRTAGHGEGRVQRRRRRPARRRRARRRPGGRHARVAGPLPVLPPRRDRGASREACSSPASATSSSATTASASKSSSTSTRRRCPPMCKRRRLRHPWRAPVVRTARRLRRAGTDRCDADGRGAGHGRDVRARRRVGRSERRRRPLDEPGGRARPARRHGRPRAAGGCRRLRATDRRGGHRPVGACDGGRTSGRRRRSAESSPTSVPTSQKELQS